MADQSWRAHVAKATRGKAVDQPRKVHFDFQPIKGHRAFEEVVDQITLALRSGAYAPGERLPVLDDLAKTMETSRPTVAEAIAVLANAGVLEARRGQSGGIVVLRNAVPSAVMGLARPLQRPTLRELTEARRPIEMSIAQLAGQRAIDEHFNAMQKAIDMLAPARGHRNEWVHANDLFHYEMARAAGSKMLALYSHQIMEELAILLDGFDERYTNFEHTVWIHEKTLQAIKSRNARKIHTVMDEHLRELEDAVPRFDDDRRRKKERPTRRFATTRKTLLRPS